MMMKIRMLVGKLHKFQRDPVTNERSEPLITYYVEFYTQPFLRYWIAKLYHWYDMNRVVHWVAHRLPKRRYGTLEDGTPFTMPWCAFQDMRCYNLSRKGWVEVTRVTLDPEQRALLKKARQAAARDKIDEYSYDDDGGAT